MMPALLFSLVKEYRTMPGILTADAVEIKDRASSSIELSWPETRNTESYTVSYKEKGTDDWQEIKVTDDKTVISGLKENTEYDITVTANSEEREGTHKAELSASTKKNQEIKGKTKQQKLAGKGKLTLDSKTDLNFTSDDETVAKVENDDIEFSPGTTVVTAEAEASEEYEGKTAEVEVEVLDSISEDPSATDIHVIDKIEPGDCELVRTISDGIPQSFDYDGERFIVTFGDTSLVTYADEKTAYETKDLGHANGFAYSPETEKGYSVRGNSSACVICDLKNDTYETYSLPYGASGIAYDKARNMFYTTSMTGIVSYDKDFVKTNIISRVRHDGEFYLQDCGAYSGILMHCVSGEPRHDTNYVDLYDMVNGKYLGTLVCDLSEVESAAVDNDGYMLLLCNNSGNEDYIYRTKINIKDLGSDLII